MITSQDCINKYGLPDPKSPCLTLWDVPTDLKIGIVPKRIYCNKDLVNPLETAFLNLLAGGRIEEIVTWDGCFNIREIRGMENRMPKVWSLHSWGIAVDVNAFENQLGQVPKLSPEFVKCFKDAGFDWGGDFKRLDGMHFQLSKI